MDRAGVSLPHVTAEPPPPAAAPRRRPAARRWRHLPPRRAGLAAEPPVRPAAATFTAQPTPVCRSYFPGGGLRHGRHSSAAEADAAVSAASALTHSGRPHRRPASRPPLPFPRAAVSCEAMSNAITTATAQAATRVGANAQGAGAGVRRRPPGVPFAASVVAVGFSPATPRALGALMGNVATANQPYSW